MNLDHAVYEPAGDAPHAAILALHGWGANALDLLALAPHLLSGEVLVLCPQGTVEVPLGPQVQGYGWFPLTLASPPDPAAFESAVEGLLSFLDQAQRRYPIASEKLALLGFSQGGVMAYALALRQRARFACAAALSTWLPPQLAEAGGGVDLHGLPVLVQHGTRDELIEVGRARDSVERLRPLHAAVTYREYDMGHEISPPSLRDLDEFLRRHLSSRILTP